MNKFSFTLLTIIALLALYSCALHEKAAFGSQLFNSDWQFYRSNDTLETPLESAAWESVELPHTANIEALTVKDQWQGICYYKKSFALPLTYRDKVVTLQFDGAMNVAEVWVNGKKMTTHLGGYLPFAVDLSEVAKFDTLNTVLVRLDNRDNPTTGPKPLKILDFNMYGGLYRNAHLIVKNRVHISNPVQTNIVAGGGVRFAVIKADKKQADVEIKTEVINQSEQAATIRVVHELIDTTGVVVATIKSKKISVSAQKSTDVVLKQSVASPQLWSIASPYLYTLITKVYANGELVDNQIDKVGLRTIQITPEGLWLNGEKTFLRGVNRHQEYPYIGYALSDAAQYRDAYKIKQAGFDYVRSSHYPMSPAFLDACDELGIMVLDAILGWQYFGDKAFETLALRSSRELIRRDRNHPSIFGWELSINESSMPKSFTDSANIIAHEEFPYNNSYSAGWVMDSYDIYIEARQHRHGLHPEKPLLVSEYGDWEYYAQNAGFNQQAWGNLLEEERTSRQPRYLGEKRMLQQALNIQEAHNDNLSTHAFADGYWAMFDYNRGMATEQEYSGVMDICRIPKFSYYFFKSQRAVSPNNKFEQPVLFVASYWQPNISNSVRVFSNCEEVELFVDGESVGRQKPEITALSNNLKHPPFTFNVVCTKPGSVKAVGYIDGKMATVCVVNTPSVPKRIALQVGESGKAATTNDVLLVYATIVDANGNTVNDASSDVTFTVEGAQLMSPATVKAEAGIATAVVRTGNKFIPIKISASVAGLETGIIQF